MTVAAGVHPARIKDMARVPDTPKAAAEIPASAMPPERELLRNGRSDSMLMATQSKVRPVISQSALSP